MVWLADGCSALKQVCSAFLSITFLSIFGLSVAALVGFSRYWTYYTTNGSDPGAYNVQTGWLHFRTRDVDSSSLRVSLLDSPY